MSNNLGVADLIHNLQGDQQILLKRRPTEIAQGRPERLSYMSDGGSTMSRKLPVSEKERKGTSKYPTTLQHSPSNRSYLFTSESVSQGHPDKLGRSFCAGVNHDIY